MRPMIGTRVARRMASLRLALPGMCTAHEAMRAAGNAPPPTLASLSATPALTPRVPSPATTCEHRDLLECPGRLAIERQRRLKGRDGELVDAQRTCERVRDHALHDVARAE